MLSFASAKNLGLSFSLGYCKPVIDSVLNYESHNKPNYIIQLLIGLKWPNISVNNARWILTWPPYIALLRVDMSAGCVA